MQIKKEFTVKDVHLQVTLMLALDIFPQLSHGV